MTQDAVQVDVAVFGGGAAGLWLLDELHRAGHRGLLLEANALGAGQTVASQGIIHGGLKYTLEGLFNRSADAIKDMPALWRDCLAGRRRPDLSATPVRGELCYLWSTRSLRSKVGLFAAAAGLRVKPVALPRADWPDVLANVGGSVSRLDEPVIDPAGFIKALADRHQPRLLKIDAADGLRFDVDAGHQVRAIHLRDDKHGVELDIRPGAVVLTAGEGNESLRSMLGLPPSAMQRRPLHVTVARGGLPVLNGHCIDGGRTRVTITTDTDSRGRTVWQVGGQVSEDGVEMDPPRLIEHVQSEIEATLPGLALAGVEWATYRVNRAEGATRGGKRPGGAVVIREGNVITAWPTKLVLAPVLAARVMGALPSPAAPAAAASATPGAWPRPAVAQPPWEHIDTWSRGR